MFSEVQGGMAACPPFIVPNKGKALHVWRPAAVGRLLAVDHSGSTPQAVHRPKEWPVGRSYVIFFFYKKTKAAGAGEGGSDSQADPGPHSGTQHLCSSACGRQPEPADDPAPPDRWVATVNHRAPGCVLRRRCRPLTRPTLPPLHCNRQGAVARRRRERAPAFEVTIKVRRRQ